MNTSSHEQPSSPVDPSKRGPSLRVALVMALLIGSFYLLREHWGHVLGLWPYLLLLACPLMHLMHGQGGHGHGGRASHLPAPMPTSSDRE
jgi:hypothetical protein